MLIGIHKDVCALSRHVYYEDGRFRSSESVENGCLWFGMEQDHTSVDCARTLFALEHVDVDVNPPQRYYAVSKTVYGDNAHAWDVMDTARRLSTCKRIVKDIEDRRRSCDDSYQANSFVKHTKVFKSLRPWKVAPELSSSTDPVASTFAVGDDGFVVAPTYDRFGTRTGRLTVSDGPRVLTMRQSTRTLMRPIDDDHAFVSLDYSSLEARVALAIAGRPASVDEDPYSFIAKLANISAREEAKKATFAALYSDPTSTNAKDVKVALVRRVFKLGETFSKLSDERTKSNDKVRNLYGRLIDVTGTETLYNNYVQSTGADVVLHGFLSLLPTFEQLGVKLHFLLHDAVFVSVPRDSLQLLKQICAAGVEVPMLDCKFPLKIDVG